MSTTQIVFNAKAAEFISIEKPTKVRVDASWKESEGLRLRPTTRKSGPQILLPLSMRSKGAAIDIDAATMEKMVEEGMPANFLQPGERYSVIDETYGWIVLLNGEDHESHVGLATIGVKK